MAARAVESDGHDALFVSLPNNLHHAIDEIHLESCNSHNSVTRRPAAVEDFEHGFVAYPFPP